MSSTTSSFPEINFHELLDSENVHCNNHDKRGCFTHYLDFLCFFRHEHLTSLGERTLISYITGIVSLLFTIFVYKLI